MGAGKRSSSGTVQAIVEEAAKRGARAADPQEVAEADRRLEELLHHVAEASVSPEAAPAPTPPVVPSSRAALGSVAMRTAQPVAVRGPQVTLRVRGVEDLVVAELAPGVAPELVERAVHSGDAVVVEIGADEKPLVVGVLQTRIPRELELRADSIRIEGDQELLLRSGRSALRLRPDGDVELVGSRISAVSRGLFRLVGRVLRLN